MDLDWSNEWVSAWPEPAEPVRQKFARKDLCKNEPNDQFAENGGVSLLDLPEDILKRVTETLLLNDAKGSTFARTCMEANELFLPAKHRLVEKGYAWWTGTGPPLHPWTIDPAADPKEEGVLVLDKLGFFVQGLDVKDLGLIATKCGWLTNFSIDAILLALGCPVLCATYVAQPQDGTLVLSAGLGGLGYHGDVALKHVGPVTLNEGCFWQRADVRGLICNAARLVIPLNVDGNHWVVVRVARAFEKVEVFNSTKSPSDASTCMGLQGLLRLLEGVGVTRAGGFHVVFHNSHLAWKQTDGSSCGIFASLIACSLVRGLRISLLQEDMLAWRAYLHKIVLAKIARM